MLSFLASPQSPTDHRPTNDGCRFLCYCWCDISILCDMWWGHTWPVPAPEDTCQDRGHCGPGEEARGEQDPGRPGHLQLQVSIRHLWPGLCVHIFLGRSAEVKHDIRHPTTKILETPMSTYRNKCGLRRIVQGTVAGDLVLKELGWQRLLSLSA